MCRTTTKPFSLSFLDVQREWKTCLGLQILPFSLARVRDVSCGDLVIGDVNSPFFSESALSTFKPHSRRLRPPVCGFLLSCRCRSVTRHVCVFSSPDESCVF